MYIPLGRTGGRCFLNQLHEKAVWIAKENRASFALGCADFYWRATRCTRWECRPSSRSQPLHQCPARTARCLQRQDLYIGPALAYVPGP